MVDCFNDDFDYPAPEAGHGKKINQKLKPYIVLRFLMKSTDENHVKSAKEIANYLITNCGIYAERRSVCKDIEEINKAMIMLENDIDIFEAEEILSDDEDDIEKFIVYDKHKKGYYVKQRRYEVDDIRLLAECIHSAKFLAESQAKRLADIVCEFVSDEQAKQIKHTALLTDRVKTNNKDVIYNIAIINEAMSKELYGEKHTPEKISFKYLKHTINDVRKQVERRQGEVYVVSPYSLIINDGNYYLLGFEDKKKKIMTYRVDRMKNVKLLGEEREGKEEFAKIDLKTYQKRVFSMYGGKQTHIAIRFINPLLDTVVDRFGTNGVNYTRSDDYHFVVSTDIEISNQFYGWLCGFGNRAQIIYPEEAIDGFKKHLEKINSKYQ